MIANIYFYLMSIALLVFAFKVVTTRYILRSALYLVLVLLNVGGLYLLLNAEYAAGVQVLLYVGGILVVTIFAILLISKVGEEHAGIRAYKQKVAAGLIGLMMLVLGLSFLATIELVVAPGLAVDAGQMSAHTIGRAFLSMEKDGFLLPFELISLILLVALIGSVIIARAKPDADEQSQKFVRD